MASLELLYTNTQNTSSVSATRLEVKLRVRGQLTATHKKNKDTHMRGQMRTHTDTHGHTHTHTPLFTIKTADLTPDLIAGSQLTTDKQQTPQWGRGEKVHNDSNTGKLRRSIVGSLANTNTNINTNSKHILAPLARSYH